MGGHSNEGSGSSGSSDSDGNGLGDESDAYYDGYDGNNLRANEGNPNHPSFWKKLGIDHRPDNWKAYVSFVDDPIVMSDLRRQADERPDDWVDPATHKRRRGLLEFKINQAACRSKEERKAAGRDAVKVVDAAKKALGGQAMVLKNGSQAKKTDLNTSDLDLKIAGTQMTSQTRSLLQQELQRTFSGKVEVTRKGILRVQGESGQLCIVPMRADFYDEEFEAGCHPQCRLSGPKGLLQATIRLGKNDFEQKPEARKAVRAPRQIYLKVIALCGAY